MKTFIMLEKRDRKILTVIKTFEVEKETDTTAKKKIE